MNELAVKVSPPEGTRGVRVTRSVLREPIIVIVLAIVRAGDFDNQIPILGEGESHLSRQYFKYNFCKPIEPFSFDSLDARKLWCLKLRRLGYLN